MIAACGGGGGGGSSSPPASSSPPPPPPPPTGTIPWTQGQYPAASQFENQCQVVRTGQDIEGNPFPDQPGTLTQEMFWIRSWTHETYLWNDEVTDRDPNTFDDRLAYFDLQRTFALTASGENKDDFHFSQPTDEYLRQRNSAPEPSYGASFGAVPPFDGFKNEGHRVVMDMLARAELLRRRFCDTAKRGQAAKVGKLLVGLRF